MANFLKLTARNEQRIGQYATRLFRIESHLNRGELRAAAARIQGFRDELLEFAGDLEFPFEMTLLGTQLGLISGKGSFMRGRLPAALLGGAIGWLYAQSQTTQHQRYVAEIIERVDLIEALLASDEAQEAARAAATAAKKAQPTADPAGAAAAESAAAEKATT